MKIVRDWVPKNDYTKPLNGIPQYENRGIIKVIDNREVKMNVGEIAYQQFDDENFQYIISPFWDVIDGLPIYLFQGIPGINMDLRLEHYYRVNYTPVFITERTPAKNREDLWELLESVGLDYYDRLEWLIRTTMRAANDNLIVERKREHLEFKIESSSKIEFDKIISSVQYGDKIVLSNFKVLTSDPIKFNVRLFDLLASGATVQIEENDWVISDEERSGIMKIAYNQAKIYYEKWNNCHKLGIAKAKAEGKYKGRKRIDVDKNLLEQIAELLRKKVITVNEAMQRTDIPSKSTFYRRLKETGITI